MSRLTHGQIVDDLRHTGSERRGLARFFVGRLRRSFSFLERLDTLVVGERANQTEKRFLGSVSEGVLARAVNDVYVVR